MNNHTNFLSPIYQFIILCILCFSLLAKKIGAVDPNFQTCGVPQNCGDGQNIKFPFYIQDKQKPSCGYPGFNLTCNKNGQPIISISRSNYIIQKLFYQNQTIRVSNSAFSYSNSNCIPLITSISLPNGRFELAPHQTNLSLFYNCSSSLQESFPSQFYSACDGKNESSSVLALSKNDRKQLSYVSKECRSEVMAPVEAYRNGSDGIVGVLRIGFLLKWKASNCNICEGSGGLCGFEYGTFSPKCFCPDRPHALRCNTENKKNKVVIVIAVGCAVIIFMIFVSFVIWYHYKKKETLTNQIVKTFLRNDGHISIRRYNYSDIKTMTNSFKDKLGQGGYGSVYKGKLEDGCFVAVKVLKELKGNGEEFINEVASISRTSHVNIVTLKGFCYTGSKRALIYEFLPNGSLEKFIYKGNASIAYHHLGWETLYKIAVGIARGLEYLHRGCNTRILHFDIKPHNILLDENFCPKISDFGLAKICPREKSVISMVGARGTIGYIAPEVFCRNFGGVSNKSDVYSYGMMVLEMVGGRKNIDVNVDCTSEIYFPHWIYKRLELDEELGLQGLLNEADQEGVRKMILVSLWCIQTDPSNRPSMSRVVDMLEGSLDSLQIPPKPFLSSPSRSPTDSSTV